jgi:hypothetical protein
MAVTPKQLEQLAQTLAEKRHPGLIWDRADPQVQGSWLRHVGQLIDQYDEMMAIGIATVSVHAPFPVDNEQLREANAKAADGGIQDYMTVRGTLIHWRNNAMNIEPPDWHAATFLSHVIWWMSTLGKAASSKGES